jgi:hemolysin activation/secretion protein
VQEIKPWTAYFQLSNTGTEQTDEWRERFGFVHNQLVGFDDILSLDYITSNFRESHAAIGSYDFPLTPDGRLRAKVNGEWTDYRASDVGVANERFEGRTYGIGGELQYNFLQIDDLFVDVYGGAMWRDIEVINVGLVNGRGQEDVLVSDFGVRAERRRANYSFGAEVGVEVSLNQLLSTSETELERLGRLNPDEDWTVAHFDVDFSFYLDGVGSWNAGNRALVHELAMRMSGQYAFNNRLVPNYQTVGGGLYTVRGYDESVVAGDTGIFGSLEYRFHLPNALPVAENPPTIFGRPFRVARDGEGLPPEWDFIAKAFLDAGYVENSRALGFESEESLLSTGLGLELQITQNFSFRTDWGIVLDEIASNSPTPTTVGTQRWHFVFTLLY